MQRERIRRCVVRQETEVETAGPSDTTVEDAIQI